MKKSGIICSIVLAIAFLFTGVSIYKYKQEQATTKLVLEQKNKEIQELKIEFQESESRFATLDKSKNGEVDKHMVEQVQKLFTNVYTITYYSPRELIDQTLKDSKRYATQDVLDQIFKGYDEESLKNINGIPPEIRLKEQPSVFVKERSENHFAGLVICKTETKFIGKQSSEKNTIFEIEYDMAQKKVKYVNYLGLLNKE